LSAKSWAMTESEQRVLMTVKDAICSMKNLGRDPRLADISLVDREAQARRAGRAAPDRNPNSVAAEERPVWPHPYYRAPPEPIGVDRRCSGRSQWHASALSMSSIRYCEVARWLSAFRTYSSRSNS
jgi:hypothetical protein